MTSAVKYHGDAGIGRAVASLGLVPDFVDAAVIDTTRDELCGGYRELAPPLAIVDSEPSTRWCCSVTARTYSWKCPRAFDERAPGVGVARSGAAHEEELRQALVPVAEAFKRWQHGDLGSGELSEIIHRFHQGPARDLYVRYNTARLEMAVAYAVTAGILDRQTIPAELLDHLAGPLQFYETEQTTS